MQKVEDLKYKEVVMCDVCPDTKLDRGSELPKNACMLLELDPDDYCCPMCYKVVKGKKHN